MHSAHDLQRTMLRIARERATNPSRWMSELAAVLNKTKHSVYKKVQGDIGLSLDEVIRLTEHYDLNIDPLLRPETALSFEFSNGLNSSHPDQYFRMIETHLARIANLPDVVLWHSGIELPFVHDYNFPRLTAFKFFIHQRALWAHQDNRNGTLRFEDFQLRLSLDDVLHRILDGYYALPSVEFWNTMILDITLSQIRHCLESGLFKHPETAGQLCSDLRGFVDHMEGQAADEIKTNRATGTRGSSFVLYHNEIVHSNNLILVSSATKEYIFLSFGNPHYMFTTADRAVRYTRERFESLKFHSQRISGGPRKVRQSYFGQLRNRVTRASDRITSYLKLHAV